MCLSQSWQGKVLPEQAVEIKQAGLPGLRQHVYLITFWATRTRSGGRYSLGPTTPSAYCRENEECIRRRHLPGAVGPIF